MNVSTRTTFFRVVVAALALAAGCETIYKDGNGLHTFKVELTPGKNQTTGSEDNPLDYISGTSCADNPCPGEEECLEYCAVSGAFCSLADDQCGNNDYCMGVCAKPVYLDIQGIRRNGDLYAPTKESLKKRWVHVKAVPGMVPPPYEYVELNEGKAENVTVYIAQSVGTGYIWVEDIGMGPSDALYGQCNNNVDDDKDGWIDLADPDCESSGDPVERPATYATGLSPPFYFQNPRIWHIQYTDQVSLSPLAGQNIYVDEGTMVVTNVVANGFFITDMEYPDGSLSKDVIPPFSSFFLYTFNKPEGIRYGDLLCSFSGGVVEYQGNTQMTFPTYDVAAKSNEEEEEGESTKEEPCEHPVDLSTEVPEPVDVTDLLIEENPKSSNLSNDVMANATALEPYESGLIKIREADLSNRFIACDSDENDAYPSASDDDACRDECQEDPYCTQLESFFKYSQMSAFAQVGKKFYVGIEMLKENMPLEIPYIGSPDQSGNCPDIIDPDTGEVVVENPHKVLIGDTLFIEYLCPARQLKSVSGNLRHIYLCSLKPGKKERCGLQMTMLIPRFDDDFEFMD